MKAIAVDSISKDDIVRFALVYTECAHVVPESTHFDVLTTRASSNEKVRLTLSSAITILILCKKDYAASVLAVLKRFGYDIENLNGPKVHSLYNVMTMEKNVHDYFDRLEIWFEATVRATCTNLRILTSHLDP